MKCNLGQTEKYVRLMLGVMVFCSGVFLRDNFSGRLGMILLLLSLFLLLTAAFSWCPCTWVRIKVRERRATPVPDENPASEPPTV
ncbi:MAG TPA: DUF2892 domain-containing protein [Elusimicrobiota bacterium]|nr:DUF2892 domain-containing protein [Elusimicrobiota bacterium]